MGEHDMVDEVYISWIGPTAFEVERNGVTRAFSLEEGQVVPPEFKKGDLVELHLVGDPIAEIWGAGKSKGYYLFKHIASGKEFKTWHRAEAFRFEKEYDTRPCPREGCTGTQKLTRRPDNIPNARVLVARTNSPVVPPLEWAWVCDMNDEHYELPDT